MYKRFFFHEATRGSLLSIVDQGIVSLSNFLTGVFVARAVGVNEFGVYSLLYVSLMVLGGIQNALITGPIRVLGIRTPEHIEKGYFHAQLKLQLLLSCVLSIGVGCVILFISPINRPILSVFLVSLFFFQLQEFSRITNLTKFALWRLLFLDLLTHGLRLLALGLLSTYMALTAINTFWIIALTCAIGFMFNSMFQKRTQQTLPLGEVATENWKYGRWILFEAIIFTISTQAYVYMMALWVDTQSAGALNAIVSLLNVVNIFQLGIMSFAIPRARLKLITYGYNAWKRWLLQVGLVLMIGTVISMAFVAIFAKPLLMNLYTPFFGTYAYLIPLLAVSYVLAAANTVLNAAFLTAQLPRVGFIAKLASGVLTLFLAYPIINRWGISGAVMGLVGTAASWTFVYLVYIYKGALLPKYVEVALQPHN